MNWSSVASIRALPTDGIHESRARNIFRGGASAAAAKILTTLLSLVSLPLTVHYLGAGSYGVWVTIISISAWVSVLEFGLTDTLTNTISECYASGDQSQAARHTTNALVIALAIACGLFGFGVLAWPHIDWSALFNVKQSVPPTELSSTVAIACSLILLTPLCTIGTKILSGYQQTHVANLFTAITAALSVVGIVAGIHLRLSMHMLYLCTMGPMTLSGLGLLTWTIWISKPWLRPRAAYLSRRLSRELLGAGAPYFLIRLAGIVVFSTDNVIIGHYLGSAEVTPYSIAMRLVTYTQLISIFLFQPLWAAYAEANARQDFSWIKKAYSYTLRKTVLITVAALLLLVCFGRWLIRIWTGPVGVPSEALLMLMCVWSLILTITTIQSCLLGAVGRTRIQAIASTAAAVVNLFLSIFLVQRLGSIGAVLGTILSYVLILGPQSREISRYFRLDQSKSA